MTILVTSCKFLSVFIMLTGYDWAPTLKDAKEKLKKWDFDKVYYCVDKVETGEPFKQWVAEHSPQTKVVLIDENCGKRLR
jgi:hypothetical protein